MGGRTMTPRQFLALLARVGASQGRISRLLHVSRRQVTRWASGDASIPHMAAVVLRAWDAGKIGPEDLA